MRKYFILPGLILVLALYLLGLHLFSVRQDDFSAHEITTQVKTEEAKVEVAPDNRISLNEATKSDLMRIKGIGEKTAENILNAREKVGRFYSYEELMEIPGIGEKTMELIKQQMTIE